MNHAGIYTRVQHWQACQELDQTQAVRLTHTVQYCTVLPHTVPVEYSTAGSATQMQ